MLFSKSAPVGHTCTHLPQRVQVELPQGSLRSEMIIAVDAAAHRTQHMRALDLSAGAHASNAKNATVVIDDKPFVRSVNVQFGIAIGQPDVGQTQLLAKRLQFAMAVGDADRADMVAFGEEQLEDGTAVLLEALGVRAHLHAFLHSGHAGRQQFVVALDLHQAQPARAKIAQAVQVAERGNVDVILARHLQDRLAG